MLVREAMTSPVVTIPCRASIRQAIRILYEHRIAALPVLDDAGRLAGIVSEMDLLRGEFQTDPRAFARPVATAHEPPPRRVEEVMTKDVWTVRPGSDMAELAETMMRTGFKSVPVVDDTGLVGIVSRQDLLAVLARSDARVRDDVLSTMAECLPEDSGRVLGVHNGVVELRGSADDHAPDLADLIARTVPGVVRVVVTGG